MKKTNIFIASSFFILSFFPHQKAWCMEDATFEVNQSSLRYSEILKEKQELILLIEKQKQEQARIEEQNRILSENLAQQKLLETTRMQQIVTLTKERDLARKIGVVSGSHLRHYWHRDSWGSDNEGWHIDYTDIDEAINGNGYAGQVTRQQIIDHLNADPSHNGKPNPYLTILHKYRDR